MRKWAATGTVLILVCLSLTAIGFRSSPMVRARPVADSTAFPTKATPAAAATAQTGKPVAAQTPTAASDTRLPVAFGLYNPGVPDNMVEVAATENAVGKHAAILMWYKHWGGAW